MAAEKTTIAFDLYGTLLSTDSIAAALSHHFSLSLSAAGALAALWRRYQLEYTWRINSMGIYRPFSLITLQSLHHAVAESSLPPISDEDGVKLMKAYDSLSVFPEVPRALANLADHVDAYVFSNGTYSMISASVNKSPDLNPSVFKGLLSIEDVEAYKPSRKAYEYILEQFGGKEERQNVWLVSSNPFDVIGAVGAGLKAVWVDRTGKGWVDRLGEVIGGDIKPTAVVKGVDEAVEEILGRS
ncbi:hypothetical protein QBC35DRAFT_484696 [Podospora australis]|uniref:Haloacid dehalogenase n=1 Tax=Podospora australis TaxID=1536484 RepID=A0AAN7AMK7_9PEZI|nr:hypothetical protein QBC35DRAFT_484696 [Podospora australis]